MAVGDCTMPLRRGLFSDLDGPAFTKIKWLGLGNWDGLTLKPKSLGLWSGLQIFEVLETFSIEGGLLEVVFTFSTSIFGREKKYV